MPERGRNREHALGRKSLSYRLRRVGDTIHPMLRNEKGKGVTYSHRGEEGFHIVKRAASAGGLSIILLPVREERNRQGGRSAIQGFPIEPGLDFSK